MVVTRSQASQRSIAPSRMLDNIDRLRRGRRWIKRYKSTDASHRHRIHDRQPKSVNVVSYTRRS